MADLLIEIIFDPSAREDEIDDALMDIGEYNDIRAIEALVRFSQENDEDNFLTDSCGESIARIWLLRDEFDIKKYRSIGPRTRSYTKSYLNEIKPEWFVLDD